MIWLPLGYNMLTPHIGTIKKKSDMKNQESISITGLPISPIDEAVKTLLSQQDISDIIDSFEGFRGLLIQSELPHQIRLKLDGTYLVIRGLLKTIQENNQL